MKPGPKAHHRTQGSAEQALWEAPPSLKALQLRLLMKEREGLASRLLELDFTIWALEEYFRAGNPAAPRS